MNYKCAILVSIKVACLLFKLVDAIDFLQCSELFANKKSTIHLVLQELIYAVNEIFKNQAWWLECDNLMQMMEGFKDLLGPPRIQRAIDATQIHVQKPKSNVLITNYYSFKSKGYNLQFQVIVDHKKRFIDIFVGMSRSMNDVRMLCLSSIYWKATWEELFNKYNSHKSINPNLIGDKGYPLLTWLMVPHKQINERHFVS
jgi:hypothetical protein